LGLSAEALAIKILQIKPRNPTIVELQPLLLLGLYEAVIMPELGCPVMGNHTHELVLGRLLGVGRGLGVRGDRVGLQVELHWELQFCIDLFVYESVVIKDDAL
jgi:hypothetical protein